MTMLPRHVAFMTTRLGRGGAERQIVQIACMLKARGWRVDVISLMEPLDYQDELNKNGIRCISLGFTGRFPRLSYMTRAIRQLRSMKPAILVTFLYHANVLGRIAGRMSRIPVVISSIRNELFGGWIRDLAERTTSRWSHAVIVNSIAVKATILRRHVISPDRLFVIPNGVANSERESDAPRINDANAGPERFIWLNVAHLHPQKDHQTLLKAFKEVLENRPDSKLLIAGTGPLQDNLERMAKHLGIAGSVEFKGMCKDIPRLLNESDGFVLSSAWEGMPNAVMEAMVAGKPVVATQVGGVGELVEDGVSGFLVPPHQPGLLSGAMVKTMGLPQNVRNDMGSKGRKWINRKYRMSRIVDEWETLFENLMVQRSNYRKGVVDVLG